MKFMSDDWIDTIYDAVDKQRQKSGYVANNDTVNALDNLYNEYTNNQVLQNNNIQNNIDTSKMNLVDSAKAYNLNGNDETIQSINQKLNDRGISSRFDGNLFTNADGTPNKNINALWRTTTDENGNTHREIVFNPYVDGDINEQKTMQQVTIHEMLHDMAGDKQVRSDLFSLILDKNKTRDGYGDARSNLEEMYSQVYDKNSENFKDLVDEEEVADTLAQKLGDQDFINSLNKEKPNVFKRIYDWVVDKLNKFTGSKNEKIYWEDVKNKFENAFRQDYQGNNIEKSKFSINSNFNQEYDSWNKIDRQGNFLIGRTSEALKSIGLDDYDIVIDKSKILKIKNDHPEMSDDIIKSIPEILENPTLILDSQSKNKKAQGRKVIFGEIQDTKGNPVLVALELNPYENKNNIDKIYKVASAYGKENLGTIQKWISDEKNILYIDKQKNRTMNWLNGLGLQLPVPNNLSSSTNSIPTSNNNVNTTNNNSMQESENNSGSFNLSKTKQKQLELIKKSNPMLDDYHTGVRTVDDIKTFKEAYDIAKKEASDGGWDEYASYPDITNEMIEDSLKTGKITVYSSNDIKNGAFVTPSYEQALEYAGNDSSKIRSKKVKLDDVAWINLDEGQYAKVNNSYTKPSIEQSGAWQSFLENQIGPIGKGKTIQELRLPTKENLNTIKQQNIINQNNKERLKDIGITENSDIVTKGNDENIDEEKIANILTEMPTKEKEKSRALAILKANILDKGIVFEELSRKTKNRELQGKWDYTLTASARGQNAIGNPRYEFDSKTKTQKLISKSLESIREEVGKNIVDFNEYMYQFKIELKGQWKNKIDYFFEFNINNNNKISIIVPIYNSEEYLIQCVNSLRNQSYRNIEIILIDDGSNDSSLQLCEMLASIDNRIKVYHQENHGLSSARNKGIELATGDYIGFVDSDDFVENDMYENLIKNIKKYNTDVSAVRAFIHTRKGNVEKFSNNPREIVCIKSPNLITSYCDGIVSIAVWDKIFKKEALKGIRFREDVFQEDSDFILQLCLAGKSFVCDTKEFYHYMKRDEGSLTGTKFSKKLFHLQDWGKESY